MISRLWLTLTHFFDYKPDISVKFPGTGTSQPSPGHVVVIHRSYRVRGGEDTFLFDVLIPQLMAVNVSFEIVGLPALFSRPQYRFLDFLEVLFMTLGLEKLRPSYLEVTARSKRQKPTHVIFNNVLPTVSLGLPAYFRKNKIKTFLWIHNSRLQCANGLNFNNKTECHRCVTKGSRWALVQKCLPTFKQSLLYAWIYRGRRVIQKIFPFIDTFIAVSEYSAKNLEKATTTLGLPPPSTVVIRTTLPFSPLPSNDRGTAAGVQVVVEGAKKIPKPFYAYIGRLSFEKGADRLVELAKRFQDKGFLVCGDGPLFEKIKSQAPKNLVLTGYVGQEAKEWVFQEATAVLIPSRVPETSSLVITESQKFGTPIVYPAGGGAEETFRIQNRSGCSLEEFQGQTFKKTAPVWEEEDSSFTNNLKAALHLEENPS